MSKARMASLADKMQDAPAVLMTEGKPVWGLTDPTPAKHGEKGDYVKLTVTLPPEVYRVLAEEVTRRKLAKEPEPVISAVLRDAVLKQVRR